LCRWLILRAIQFNTHQHIHSASSWRLPCCRQSRHRWNKDGGSHPSTGFSCKSDQYTSDPCSRIRHSSHLVAYYVGFVKSPSVCAFDAALLYHRVFHHTVFESPTYPANAETRMMIQRVILAEYEKLVAGSDPVPTRSALACILNR
jgi:hypothetical protein